MSIGRQLGVAVCGLATSVLTVWLLVFLERRTGVAFYSITLWFVLPVGAAVSGIAGESGYYWGSRLLGVRPDRFVVGSTIAVSVATFVLLHYAEYRLSGLSPAVAFETYLDRRVRQTATDIRMGPQGGTRVATTRVLGDLGYGVAALQIVGFAAGGLLLFRWLRQQPYCERCAAFLASSAASSVSTDHEQQFAAAQERVRARLEAGDVPGALQAHSSLGGGGLLQRGRHDFRSRMRVRQCRSCGQEWVRVMTKWRVSGGYWAEAQYATFV